MNQPLSITTSHQHTVCDVCARTLLRGERSEVFLNGGRRYNVCELCKSHALHEGWVREGSVPELPAATEQPLRRHSLFGRRRNRADRGVSLQAPAPPRTLDDELSMGEWGLASAPAPGSDDGGWSPEPYAAAPPAGRRGSQAREPRHVHAIPSSGDHKVAVAVDIFNASTHRRTVAGVARSLGAPVVHIAPDPERPSLVWIVASWELCWYRYEIDLSDAAGHARLDGQGYELSELTEGERIGNASADENGTLILQ